MQIPDPIDANAALWAYYFEHEWPALPDPLVRRFVARGAGTVMAAWLALVTGPEVARLFAENAVEVSAFVEQVAWEAPEEVPDEFRRSEPAAPIERRPVEQRVAFAAPWREAVAIA
jgi:hypothetical protein